MPKITRYVQDSEVTATDKILGTDSSGATKNYTLQSIANHVKSPYVIAVNIEDSNIGQSGNIIITNPSSVTSLAFAELGSNFKTPSGATINFDLTADKIAIISYIVLTTDSILVNYIGDFS